MKISVHRGRGLRDKSVSATEKLTRATKFSHFQGPKRRAELPVLFACVVRSFVHQRNRNFIDNCNCLFTGRVLTPSVYYGDAVNDDNELGNVAGCVLV